MDAGQPEHPILFRTAMPVAMARLLFEMVPLLQDASEDVAHEMQR